MHVIFLIVCNVVTQVFVVTPNNWSVLMCRGFYGWVLLPCNSCVVMLRMCGERRGEERLCRLCCCCEWVSSCQTIGHSTSFWRNCHVQAIAWKRGLNCVAIGSWEHCSTTNDNQLCWNGQNKRFSSWFLAIDLIERRERLVVVKSLSVLHIPADTIRL